MAQGTVKWFNDAKGFGFIEPEGGGEDVFAHFSAIQMEGFRTLKQGGKVTYDLVQGPKGQLAQNICSVESGTASRDVQQPGGPLPGVIPPRRGAPEGQSPPTGGLFALAMAVAGHARDAQDVPRHFTCS